VDIIPQKEIGVMERGEIELEFQGGKEREESVN
jgi:hypothetical protein